MCERSSALEWPDDVELVEYVANATVFFTGVRVAVIDGAAHLLLYVEQPSMFKATEMRLATKAAAASTAVTRNQAFGLTQFKGLPGR